jgi:hypothetical protein
MLPYVLEDLLEWLEWHPRDFGVTWADFLFTLALVVPFLWMVRGIVLEVIKTNAQIREHDKSTAKSMETLQKLSPEQDDGTPDERKKDK